MSEKTSRKHFLFAAGATVAGWLAFSGFRRVDAATTAVKAANPTFPVEAKREPRAVARPRV